MKIEKSKEVKVVDESLRYTKQRKQFGLPKKKQKKIKKPLKYVKALDGEKSGEEKELLLIDGPQKNREYMTTIVYQLEGLKQRLNNRCSGLGIGITEYLNRLILNEVLKQDDSWLKTPRTKEEEELLFEWFDEYYLFNRFNEQRKKYF